MLTCPRWSAVILLALAAGCADRGDLTAEPAGLVRVIHFSDLHYLGTPLDPGPHHLLSGAQQINAQAFPADLAVVTGDLVDFAAGEYDDPALDGPLHICLSHLSALAAPLAAVPGNHDYCAAANPLTVAADKALRESVLEDALGASPLYRAIDINGVRIVLLNSMDGELWDDDCGIAGSFSDAQLAWLDGQLDAGMPSLLFLHHPPDGTAATAGQASLCDLIEKHPGVVKGIFSGHVHGFLKSEYCGVPSYVVYKFAPGEVFYFLIECDGAAGTLTIVNEAEIPFTLVPTLNCIPGQGELADPAAAAGAVHRLQLADVVTVPADALDHATAALQALPLLVRLDGWDAGQDMYHGRLTVGRETGGAGSYIDHLAGAPCIPLDFSMSNPCFMAGPISLSLDVTALLPLLPDAPPAGPCPAPIPIEELWLAGQLSHGQDGGMTMTGGGLHARVQAEACGLTAFEIVAQLASSVLPVSTTPQPGAVSPAVFADPCK